MKHAFIAGAVLGLLLSTQGLAQESKKLTPKPAELPEPTKNAETNEDASTTTAASEGAVVAPESLPYALPPNHCPPMIPHLSTGVLNPTPQMWFYQEELRQYLDPRLAVRRNAEVRAAQRQARIAARKWYGMSNSRPYCSPDPFNGDYSPHWSNGSPNYPNRWSWTPRPWFVVGAGGRPWIY